MRSLMEGRFVRLVFALASILFGMMGCDEREKTVTTTISSKSPAGTNAIRVVANKALAKFQCIDSVSGECEFVVFLADCAADDAQNACKPTPVADFVVKAGSFREIADLPEGFKFCAGHGKKPVAPGCLK